MSAVAPPLRYIGPPLRDSIAEALNYRDPRDIEQAVWIYRMHNSAVGMFQDLLRCVR